MPIPGNRILATLWAGALLSGCAGHSESIPVSGESSPDCSFRSPTSCWTMTGRFPPPEPAATDSQPEPEPGPGPEPATHVLR